MFCLYCSDNEVYFVPESNPKIINWKNELSRSENYLFVIFFFFFFVKTEQFKNKLRAQENKKIVLLCTRKKLKNKHFFFFMYYSRPRICTYVVSTHRKIIFPYCLLNCVRNGISFVCLHCRYWSYIYFKNISGSRVWRIIAWVFSMLGFCAQYHVKWIVFQLYNKGIHLHAKMKHPHKSNIKPPPYFHPHFYGTTSNELILWHFLIP